jgi:tellurite resistance protein TerC
LSGKDALLTNTALWAAFIVGIVILLALDMGVLHRKAHTMKFREAVIWSIVWVTLAMAFAAGVFYTKGRIKGMEFLAGYVIELSLSVDNVFLFIVIFKYFSVPAKYQHRILFWGILSAVVLRGVMILAGTALIKQFHWITYVFGAFLLFTAWKMFQHREETPDVGHSPVLLWLRRHIRLTQTIEGQNFLTRIDGKLYATPLFLVLALVETTDVLFALDSIPAIFGITDDGFIIFTSNILAILGLRSLYFLISGVMELFHYLSTGLSFVLGFVGLKMLLKAVHVDIPIGNSLFIIAMILTVSIVASLIKTRMDKNKEALVGSVEHSETLDAARGE